MLLTLGNRQTVVGNQSPAFGCWRSIAGGYEHEFVLLKGSPVSSATKWGRHMPIIACYNCAIREASMICLLNCEICPQFRNLYSCGVAEAKPELNDPTFRTVVLQADRDSCRLLSPPLQACVRKDLLYAFAVFVGASAALS